MPSQEETDVAQLLRRMFARPEYLLPLVAAERQIRVHYYRLNAAALLEDLFNDAVTNYIKQHAPTLSMSPAPLGAKGWDYQFAGVRLSHKTYGGGDIAAIWDATKKDTTWTFDAALLISMSRSAPDRWRLRRSEAQALTLTDALFEKRRTRGLHAGDTISVVHWPARDVTPRTLLSVPVQSPHKEAWTAFPFEDLWRCLAAAMEAGAPANELEVLVTRGRGWSPGDPLEPDSPVRRPGMYLISLDQLKDVPVRPNNRALLVDEARVATWLEGAREQGLFVPLTVWYQAYAEDRPPDLYSVQRLEYDALFSARGFRR